ncbi:ABC transporter ATP-binding protein [Haloquadratum walsbyi]|jgi:ABC-type dipeptide/oligopeptide/nickel transport system, ATPase component|uniref:Oligopeptide/dipeptide ABC transporter, ATP-binding protein, C-terminal domain protein n=1 Tax=Haloquadratum walsbyi J07HQW2 TaxID=1238425 RepID=U1PQW9_9EURY|nr:ABC transporter ATP-binding protein [Haloquadratum walsbyi]ERG96162.1 MAG: oligopeptide/dipeptide ABC transporter, ATP-binding protein, C-terminal domain protein [Haloquadratum walsbyi J07HQW2]
MNSGLSDTGPGSPKRNETVTQQDTDTTTTSDNRYRREIMRVAGLKKYFPTETGFFERFFGEQQHAKAVDGIDLTVHEGETVGIVGESGCGKSTLGRTLTRLYEPTDGSVIFDYDHIETLSGSDLRPIRRRMQYVFQDPLSALNPRKTVGESVAKPLEVHDIADGEAKWNRVIELFEEVGLSHSDIDVYPHQLSGGQRQRVGLCRALITEPDLIVFDEPVSALDVTLQAQILNLIDELQDTYDLSYVFISHDLNVVRHVCDRIAVMYAGEIVERGHADDIFNNPQHPYTKVLLRAIPSIRDEDHERESLAGTPPSVTNPPSGCRFHTRCPEFIDGQCVNQNPENHTVDGDDNHTVACHWTERSDHERENHVPPSQSDREIIKREASTQGDSHNGS